MNNGKNRMFFSVVYAVGLACLLLLQFVIGMSITAILVTGGILILALVLELVLALIREYRLKYERDGLNLEEALVYSVKREKVRFFAIMYMSKFANVSLDRAEDYYDLNIERVSGK